MQEKTTVSQATASMILGILSFVVLGILAAIPAVICGHIAKSKIKADPENLQGDGLALAGLIMGYIQIGLSILLIPLLAAIAIPSFVQARDTAMEMSCRNNQRMIESAKHACAAEQSLPDGSQMTVEQIGVYLKGGMEALICPQEGEYTIHPLGTAAECSIHSSLE